jgi:hypothetical protein
MLGFTALAAESIFCVYSTVKKSAKQAENNKFEVHQRMHELSEYGWVDRLGRRQHLLRVLHREVVCQLAPWGDD